MKHEAKDGEMKENNNTLGGWRVQLALTRHLKTSSSFVCIHGSRFSVAIGTRFCCYIPSCAIEAAINYIKTRSDDRNKTSAWREVGARRGSTKTLHQRACAKLSVFWRRKEKCYADTKRNKVIYALLYYNIHRYTSTIIRNSQALILLIANNLESKNSQLRIVRDQCAVQYEKHLIFTA